MSPFSDMCKDSIYVVINDSEKRGPYKASCQTDKIYVFESSFHVIEEQVIERLLPSGILERYYVERADFLNDDDNSHWQISVRKTTSTTQKKIPATTINILGSQGIQIGDNNTQTIVDSFKDIIARIDNGPGTSEEKKEAKSKLKAFLEHPLTSAIVGAAAAGLIQSLQ